MPHHVTSITCYNLSEIPPHTRGRIQHKTYQKQPNYLNLQPINSKIHCGSNRTLMHRANCVLDFSTSYSQEIKIQLISYYYRAVSDTCIPRTKYVQFCFPSGPWKLWELKSSVLEGISPCMNHIQFIPRGNLVAPWFSPFSTLQQVQAAFQTTFPSLKPLLAILIWSKNNKRPLCLAHQVYRLAISGIKHGPGKELPLWARRACHWEVCLLWALDNDPVLSLSSAERLLSAVTMEHPTKVTNIFCLYRTSWYSTSISAFDWSSLTAHRTSSSSKHPILHLAVIWYLPLEVNPLAKDFPVFSCIFLLFYFFL